MFFTIGEIENKIQLHGRCVIYNGKLNMDWVGAGFSCQFKGDSVRIFFETAEENEIIYVSVELDGVKHKASISNSNRMFELNGLSEGVHELKLLRITEISTPMDDITDYLFVSGFAVEKICEIENKKRMIIDFYGDSITNAWASLAAPDDERRRKCDNDYTVSYAYLTALEFDAEARICAVSGHGVVSDCHGQKNEPMKLFYNKRSRYLPISMDFSKQPEIIVVALGTNDCFAGVSDAEMRTGIGEFISLLRSDSPDSKIIWMYGMMNDRYIPMMRELFCELSEHDKNISFLPVEAVSGENDELGAFGHPNPKGEKRIAKKLIDYIKSELK